MVSYKNKSTGEIITKKEVFKLAKDYASNFKNLLSYNNIIDKTRFWDNLTSRLQQDFYDNMVDNYIKNHKEKICQDLKLDIEIFNDVSYNNYETIDTIYNYVYDIFDINFESFLNEYLPQLFDNYSSIKIWRNLDKTYRKHLYQRTYDNFIYDNFIVSFNTTTTYYVRRDNETEILSEEEVLKEAKNNTTLTHFLSQCVNSCELWEHLSDSVRTQVVDFSYRDFFYNNKEVIFQKLNLDIDNQQEIKNHFKEINDFIELAIDNMDINYFVEILYQIFTFKEIWQILPTEFKNTLEKRAYDNYIAKNFFCIEEKENN